jgi:hypothetical protein
MKNYNLFYLLLAMFHTTQGMEQPVKTTAERTHDLIEQLSTLKGNPYSFKKYQPLIQDIEAKIWANIDNKLDIIDYSLQMINQERIDFILITINSRTLKLKNKINILKTLYNLPHPKLYEETEQNVAKSLYLLERNKIELAYWLNSKEIIKEEIEIKEKQYSCEKQKEKIEPKQTHHQKISLEEWKSYQLALDHYSLVVNGIIGKERVKNLIKETKQKVILEETKDSLKEMVWAIHNDKTSDIAELSAYKITLEKYISLLPKDFAQKPMYVETIQNVCQRIKLLIDIDHELSLDYECCTLKELDDTVIEYLKNLQKQLNKPSSERYAQLEQKIKQIESLENKKGEK